MLNRALEEMGNGTLLQLDADELWGVEDLEKLEVPEDADTLQVKANFWVGPRIKVVSQHSWGNRATEWIRVWRFRRGQYFTKHEPPILKGGQKAVAKSAVCFDHYAYYFRSQVEFKQRYYGQRYQNAVEQWEALQKNREWPIELRRFFSWVPDHATVDLV